MTTIGRLKRSFPICPWDKLHLSINILNIHQVLLNINCNLQVIAAFSRRVGGCLLRSSVGCDYGDLNTLWTKWVFYFKKPASRLVEDGSDNVRQGAARHLLPVPLRDEGERNIARLWVLICYIYYQVIQYFVCTLHMCLFTSGAFDQMISASYAS